MQVSGSSSTAAEKQEEEAFLKRNPRWWGLDKAKWNLSSEKMTDKEGKVLVRLLLRMGPKITNLK